MHVLDYDGGLVDASCMGVLAALQHFRRPDVSVEGEEVKVYSLDERVPIPLSLLHHPLCITVAFFHGGEVVVMDPTLQECQISEGFMVVTANKHGEICQIAKLGGVPTDPLTILKYVELAVKKVATLTKYLSTALEQEAIRQTPKGLIAELSAENER